MVGGSEHTSLRPFLVGWGWRVLRQADRSGLGEREGWGVMGVPVRLGADDSVILFRQRLLREETDGVELQALFDRMARVAPSVAAQVVAAGSLGEISYARAVRALEVYRDTRVAEAPRGL